MTQVWVTIAVAAGTILLLVVPPVALGLVIAHAAHAVARWIFGDWDDVTADEEELIGKDPHEL